MTTFAHLPAILLLASSIWLTGACQKDDQPHPARAGATIPDAGQLFQRKAECSKFLQHLPGSLTGPDIRPAKGVVPENPVVLYSPTLNTCLYIQRYLLSGTQDGKRYLVEHASVEDLLTGQTVEEHEFDRKVQREHDAADKYEQQVMARYGTLQAESGPKQDH